MTAQPLLLVVDDDALLVQQLSAGLAAQGFRVLTAGSGEEAIEIAEGCRPDLALVDVVMPGKSGMQVMFELRARWAIPVILVTGLASNLERLRGLEQGADDYVVKPFRADELAARVRAVLRRGALGDGERVVRAGDVVVDLVRRMVRKGGVEVQLTRTEWLLLETLATNAGRVIFNAELLMRVWGPEYQSEHQYLRVWISRLRQKLGIPGDPASFIKTLPGMGYRFDADQSLVT